MEFDKLKDSVREIAEISSQVPEQFRDKCFELLLSALLKSTPERPRDTFEKLVDQIESGAQARSSESLTPVPLKTQLRVLMRKTGLTAEEIGKVVLYENEEVHFIREPHDVSVAQGQMDWALLLALKNGVLNDSLSADPEDVRSVCQDKGYYDRKNFASNFKRGVNATYFKAPLAPQGEAQTLKI